MSTVNNEGNLIFDSVEANGQKVYVAEFKATGPFSLHIERRESGRITVYQKSYENGKYATVKNVDIAPQDTIIDAEVPGGVFPKWIKIKSSSEVEVAEVTFESESSGGGAGTESTMEYLDISSFSRVKKIPFLVTCIMARFTNDIFSPFAYMATYQADLSTTATDATMVAIDFGAKLYTGETLLTVKELLFSPDYGYTEETLAAIPRITKEEFYNLEA